MFRKFAREAYRVFCNLVLKMKNRHIKIAFGARVLPFTRFEGYNKIGERTLFSGRMGRCTYIGANSQLIANIGRYTSIADKVSSVATVHPTSEFVSTSPVFFSLKKQCGKTYVSEQKFREVVKLPNSDVSLEIGNDVHVGYGVTFLGKVKVGDGAIIGANSTVTKDVEPYTIVVGTPAKVLRKRFTDEQIQSLLKISWWDKPEQWIVEKADLFDNVEKFIEECE